MGALKGAHLFVPGNVREESAASLGKESENKQAETRLAVVFSAAPAVPIQRFQGTGLE